MKFVIFDDEYSKNFYPLTETRAIADLRVGVFKLRQRIAAYLDIEKADLIVDPALEMIYRERHPEIKINELEKGDTIFVNSRLQINPKIADQIKKMKRGTAYFSMGICWAARFQPVAQNVAIGSFHKKNQSLQKEEKLVKFWDYLWDLITVNGEYIEKDFVDFFDDKENNFTADIGVSILNPYNLWLGRNCVIKPGVVLDATKGPIIIDENVTIMPNAVIFGPVYIGKNSVIKASAKIYEGTTIGKTCKIGGEVEETIIQGFSNKQHDGFLGHSYLGEWINLGADTNNSDLKNNYKTVKSYFFPKNELIDTKQQFVGTMIGDHSKTAINSTINTGTVIGVGCNLFGSDLIQKHISAFSWGKGKYELSRFLETAELVKSRRNLGLSRAEKELYSNLHHSVLTKLD